MSSRYEIRNELATQQHYVRRLARQRTAVVYRVYDTVAGRYVGQSFRLLHEAQALVAKLTAGDEAKSRKES
jgi:hypothetical protein